MKVPTKRFIPLALSLAMSATTNAQEPAPIVELKKGKLVYHNYANTGQTNKVHKLIDFSHAGFAGGGKELPEAEVKTTIEFPGYPNDPELQRKEIQDAIDYVSSLPKNQKTGMRGAVLIKSGRYEVAGSLKISTDGVVLRGEGQQGLNSGGTILVSTADKKIEFIKLEGAGIQKKHAPSIHFDTDNENETQVPIVTGESYIDSSISFYTSNVNTGSDQGVNFLKKLNSDSSITIKNINLTSLHYLTLQARRSELYTPKGKAGDGVILIYKDQVSDDNLIGMSDGHIAYDKNQADNLDWTDVTVNLDADIEGQHDIIIEFDIFQPEKFSSLEISSISLNSLWEEEVGSRQVIKDNIIPSGSYKVTVNNAASYAKGDKVIITKTVNSQWISDIDQEWRKTPNPDDPASYGLSNKLWNQTQFDSFYERTVTAKKGNTLTLDLPIVDPIENQYGGGFVYKYTPPERISHVGVEQLRLVSLYDESIKYNGYQADEEHAWEAIALHYTENSWVKDVTAVNFGTSLAKIDNYSRFNTIQDVALLNPISKKEGGRRYAFALKAGVYGNLFQRCYSNDGRHDFVTGRKTVGPNVWLDCLAHNSNADSGPHGRWATGSLYDRIKTNDFQIQHRKNKGGGQGQGWPGAQNMLWNGIIESQKPSYETKIVSPVGANNWAIGLTTNKDVISDTTKPNGPIKKGYVYSLNQPVLPSSLYLQQLADRMGEKAVVNVTTELQRQNKMQDILKLWKGAGKLPGNYLTQVLSDDVSLDSSGPNNTKVLNITDKSGNDNDQSVYLKFDTKKLTKEKIYSAKLTINLKKKVSERQLIISAIDSNAWSESSIDWTNKPSLTTTISTIQVKKPGEYEIDITDYMKNHLVDGEDFSIAIIEQQQKGSTTQLHSSSSKKDRGPKLKVISFE